MGNNQFYSIDIQITITKVPLKSKEISFSAFSMISLLTENELKILKLKMDRRPLQNSFVHSRRHLTLRFKNDFKRFCLFKISTKKYFICQLSKSPFLLIFDLCCYVTLYFSLNLSDFDIKNISITVKPSRVSSLVVGGGQCDQIGRFI